MNDIISCGTFNVSDKKPYTYNELLEYQNAKNIYMIPSFLVNYLYLFGRLIKNTFLIENTIKLLTDNIFESNKIIKFIDIKYDLKDLPRKSFRQNL